MEDFGGFCPVEIRYVTMEVLKKSLLGLRTGINVVLLLDDSLQKTFGFEDMVQQLSHRYRLIHIDRINANPTQEDIVNAISRIGERKPDKIIAVGGGSTMDLAKAISALYSFLTVKYNTITTITNLICAKTYQNAGKKIDMIMIPTTLSGSEVTKWATIWDLNKSAKFSIEDNLIYAKEIYLMPELTYHLPKRMALSTGLDALCHAVEAFWAKQTNPIIQELAVLAIKKIKNNLGASLKDPINKTAKNELRKGALLAGIAFSNTRTTACHSISYPITLNYGVEHGFACALTLNQIAERNQPAVPETGAMLREVFGDAKEGLKNWLQEVCNGIQPLTLSAFGIAEEEIEEIAKQAITIGRMDNNPVQFTHGDILKILQECK